MNYYSTSKLLILYIIESKKMVKYIMAKSYCCSQGNELSQYSSRVLPSIQTPAYKKNATKRKPPKQRPTLLHVCNDLLLQLCSLSKPKIELYRKSYIAGDDPKKDFFLPSCPFEFCKLEPCDLFSDFRFIRNIVGFFFLVASLSEYTWKHIFRLVFSHCWNDNSSTSCAAYARLKLFWSYRLLTRWYVALWPNY